MSRLIAAILLVTLFGSTPSYAQDDKSDTGDDLIPAEHANCGPYIIWSTTKENWIGFFAGSYPDGSWRRFLVNQKSQITVTVNDARTVPYAIWANPGQVTIELSSKDLDAAACMQDH